VRFGAAVSEERSRRGVWLKLGADAKSGTAVCRITTPTGLTSLELPLAARTETIHKFQGLATNDVHYLIRPDRFANGDPTNDEPADAAGRHDRSKPRAYHGGDLRGVREHLSCLKDLGVTTLGLMPILQNGAAIPAACRLRGRRWRPAAPIARTSWGAPSG